VKLSLLSVLNEITARSGPRLGSSFEFKQNEIDQIIKQFDQSYEEYKQAYGNKSWDDYKFMTQVGITSPIDGSKNYINFVFYKNPQDLSGGYYSHKYKTIGVNVAHGGSAQSIKSTIHHELTHAFDKKFINSLLTNKKTKVNKDEEIEYWTSQREVKAFTGQIIRKAQIRAQSIVSGFTKYVSDERDLRRLKQYLKNPTLLIQEDEDSYHTLIKYNPKVVNVIYKACFDIAENIIKPALEKILDKKPFKYRSESDYDFLDRLRGNPYTGYDNEEDLEGWTNFLDKTK
jgi:hypothetical protein